MENQTELSNIEINQESDVSTLSDEETLNSEPIINELEPIPNPWDDAPTGVWFYDIQYADGRLGNMTQSAERAYKRGWDLSNNISIEDVQVSDINHGYYPKDICPMKTEEQIQQEAVNQRITEIQIAVQNLLDSKAREKLYDNAFAICSYANSTDETFHSEANQFIAWRDQCWRKCYEILGLFQNGDIPMPTVGEVLRQLPELNWE